MPPPSFLEVPGAGKVSIAWSSAAIAGRAARWTFVYAPGAGSSLTDPFGVHAEAALDTAGIRTLRFQFPYTEARRRVPDRPPILEATWRAAIDLARSVTGAGERLVIGGRSMGGRIASMVAAHGDGATDALALFAYPLHPPKKPTELRVAHLASIAVPTLFVSGTNDEFGSPDELRDATRSLKGATLRFLDRADHSFGVPKSSGRTKTDVYREATDTFVEWLDEI